MRVNKYEVELDNGRVINISGCASAARAQQAAEREIEQGSSKPKYAGATKVKNVRMTQRGRWG